MPKELSFSNESREALEKGVNTVANAVKVTIGPKARNVVIERQFGSPDVVKDGSTVAKEINIENPISNLGAKLIEQVASKTKESAGDGTTTATILTQIMVQEGLKNIADGASPIEIKKGMEKGLGLVLEKLKSKSIKIDGSDVEKVATVSAGGDKEIGSIISKAMDIVTSDGVITVEESQSLETALDITEGMSFDRGYSSPYFVTDQERQICELENPRILITDQKISSLTISIAFIIASYVVCINFFALIETSPISNVLLVSPCHPFFEAVTSTLIISPAFKTLSEGIP